MIDVRYMRVCMCVCVSVVISNNYISRLLEEKLCISLTRAHRLLVAIASIAGDPLGRYVFFYRMIYSIEGEGRSQLRCRVFNLARR